MRISADLLAPAYTHPGQISTGAPQGDDLTISDEPAAAPRQPGRLPLDIIQCFHNYRNMETKDALPAFAALSQENRLDALRILVKAGPRGIAAGALGEALGLAAPTMSFHLKELANAGLITSRKDGRHVFYAADYGGIRRLVDFLMADCCQGDPRLCGPYIIKENSHEPPACPPES